MTIDKSFNLSVYQYDYGVPVVFTAKRDKGFLINDEIIFVFAANEIGERKYTVANDEYAFEFSLTKQEAENLYANHVGVSGDYAIPYSIKHYRNGVFVDTIKNATLYVRVTVPWQN